MNENELPKSDQAMASISSLPKVCEGIHNDAFVYFKTIVELACKDRKALILKNIDFVITNLEKLKIFLD